MAIVNVWKQRQLDPLKNTDRVCCDLVGFVVNHSHIFFFEFIFVPFADGLSYEIYDCFNINK